MPGEAPSGRRICLGVIVGAHGVRGLVRIKSFTADPGNLTAYGPLGDEAGTRTFTVSVVGRAKGVLLARIEGVDNRTAAEVLRGTRLYVDRAALPPPQEEEYYHADLIGLAACDPQGAPLGRVAAVHNYGAGDVLEIAGEAGHSLLVPFTRATVPQIDIPGGRIVVRPLPEAGAATQERDTAPRDREPDPGDAR